MTGGDAREVWQRGPVAGIPALLQPVAHALLQAREDVHRLADDLPEALLWERPAGVASAGFHLQHLAGMVDRLFTYARGEALTSAQLQTLRAEGTPTGSRDALIRAWDAQVDRALAQLGATDPGTLTHAREIGRARLPSTVLGLLFHAAEHAQRHVGQLLVTARVAAAPMQ